MPSPKNPSRKGQHAHIAAIGLDLAKYNVHLVAMDAAGRVVLRRHLTKLALLRLTANLPICPIGMEACSGAHYLGRALLEQGHEPRLMPPKYVKPYVKREKNDWNDAEACAEACQRPTMRFVPLKCEAQLAMQAVHRVRSRLVRSRTSLINQLRAILLERGIPVPQGRRKLQERLPEILEDADNGLWPRIRELITELRAEWAELDRRILAIDEELAAEAKANEACRRLLEVPGIGPQTATALVAAVGNGKAFDRGRDLAAWLGLTPRERSSGGKQKIGPISKSGNRYIRTLLVHCARSSLDTLAKRADGLGAWLRRMLASKPERNVVVVALAARLARIAWALLSGEKRFQPEPAPV